MRGGVCISLKEDTVMGVGVVSLSRLLILLLEFGMGGCETGNGKSKHGTAHIRDSNTVTEFDGVRMTSMFTADSNL